MNEDDWDKHIAMAFLRCNTTVNEATGMKPFKAMFAVDAFELDNEIGLQARIDEDPGVENIWQNKYHRCTKPHRKVSKAKR